MNISPNFQIAGPFALSGPELVLLLFLVFPIWYIVTLRRALESCSPESRTMDPGKVWLLLIPLFNWIWHFSVVSNMARSLHNEFARRNLPNADAEPGKSLGFAMLIVPFGGAIPVIGPVFSLAGMVCWVCYWVKIAGYTRSLNAPGQAPGTPT
jgi:hypothetical protein